MRSIVRRLTLTAFVATGVLIVAAPATAQFRPEGPAVGERYRVEGALSLWSADPSLVVSSESLGIVGDDVDLVQDLGIEGKRLSEFRAVLRPATKHKFRFHYVPMRYEADAIVRREFVFNGLRYRIGLPVSTVADFTTYRFGYEYDFVYRSRGYVGVLFDLKYTDVDVTLNSAIGAQFTRQVAPIPTFGVVGRGYIVPNVPITGELTFFKIPENLGKDEFGGRYLDFDLYGTVNFTENIGAQLGVRSVDVDYFKDFDFGNLNFTGIYIAAVARF